LPERYGKYKTVHKRFTRWAKAGVWERIFEDPTNGSGASSGGEYYGLADG
jgi:hypothetical protein